MDKKTIILVGIIIILALALFVVLVGKPYYEKTYNNHIQEKQLEYGRFLINTIIDTANAQGYVQITKEDNSTIILVKYVPQQ